MTETNPVSGAMALEAKAKLCFEAAKRATDWLVMRAHAREGERHLTRAKELRLAAGAPRAAVIKPAPPKPSVSAPFKSPKPALVEVGTTTAKESES